MRTPTSRYHCFTLQETSHHLAHRLLAGDRHRSRSRALVYYHKFDANRMAKLRAGYVRDTIEELRREAGLADKAGRAEDRVELQAKVEEVQALDRKLQQIQEGHHEGPARRRSGFPHPHAMERT